MKKKKVSIKSRRAQLDEINPIGVVGALIGGALGVVIAGKMAGGILISAMSFVVCAVACYFLASKILES